MIMQATNGEGMPPALSELEGAILSELRHRGRQTAFKVRRSFATSPSLEWRGSAGSVYAAIRRLEVAGLIEGEDQADKRGTRLLSITARGAEAMAAWACDVTRAISVGVDPFRLRSGIWDAIDPVLKPELFEQLQAALVRDIDALRGHRRYGDVIETASIDLAIRLQQSRLDWLRSLPAAGLSGR
jgi:DNA-binding PadR family transcriptional regulator